MTSMPDLRPTGWGASLPISEAQVRRPEPARRPEPITLEPQTESAARRSESRRLAADRHELETQRATAEGVRDALRDTRTQVTPRLIDVRRLSQEPRHADDREAAVQAQERLDVATEAASRTRAAAARLTAQRIAAQTQAARIAEDVQADARALADLNAEASASPAPTPARRAELESAQRRVTDRLVEATGATAVENADGTVDLRLGNRPLVEGDRVEELQVSRPPIPQEGAPAQSVVRPASQSASPPADPAVDPGPHPPVSTTAPTPPDDEPVGSGPGGALEVRWADGESAPVGGRLGGLVTADRTILRPAVEGLDQVAASIRDAVNTAQRAGTTTDGQPGPPLLEGDSALSLRVVGDVDTRDVAFGAGLPVTGAAAAPAAAGAGLGQPVTGTTPEEQLLALEGQATVTAGALGRKADVVGAFDASLGLASERLGRHVSAALGAVGDVSTGDLVSALTQANSAMTFAGAAARRAVTDGIPVVVGSSDPTVATATGTLPLDAEAGGLLRLEVLSVAGQGSGAPVPDGVEEGSAGVAGTAVAAGRGPSSGAGVSDAAVLGVPVPGDVVPGVPPGAEGFAEAAGVAPDGVVPVVTAGSSGASAAASGGSAVDGPPGAPVPSSAAVDPAALSPEAGASVDTGGSGRTRVLLGGVEMSSPTPTITNLLPGVDVSVHGPGQVTLAVTPDPGPALERVQSLVDAVGQVAAAVDPQGRAVSAGAGGTATPAAAPRPDGITGLGSVWSTLSTFASSFAPAATPAAGATPSGASQVLGAVAAPLAAAMGEAFVDAAGVPVIPGTTVDRGRVSFDRELFAREYVKDAAGVEGTIASVARSVASTADAASDPRVGALAVRIQGELGYDAEYTLDEAQADERLDSRRDVLDRKAAALQSLLEHLSEESSWLAAQLR